LSFSTAAQLAYIQPMLFFVVTLQNNSLTGVLPSSIGNWQAVQIFSVRDNQFSGTIPSTVVNWESLTTFRAQNNNFTGVEGICIIADLDDATSDCLEEVDCSCCSECF